MNFTNREAYPCIAIELVRQRELRKILSAFDAQSVDVLFFKGTALAYSLYDQAYLRPRLDNDILVRDQDLDAVEQILRSAGYQLFPQLEIFNERCYFREDEFGHPQVWDVHRRISNRELAARLFTFDELWGQRVNLSSLAPGAFRVGNTHQFVITALHAVCHHGGKWDDIWLRDGQLLLENIELSEQNSLVELIKQKNISAVATLFLEKIERFTNVSQLKMITELSLTCDSDPMRKWIIQPPSKFAQLASDGWNQPGLLAKLNFLVGLALPSRKFHKFHGSSNLSRIWRFFSR